MCCGGCGTFQVSAHWRALRHSQLPVRLGQPLWATHQLPLVRMAIRCQRTHVEPGVPREGWGWRQQYLASWKAGSSSFLETRLRLWLMITQQAVPCLKAWQTGRHMAAAKRGQQGAQTSTAGSRQTHSAKMMAGESWMAGPSCS